MPAIFFALFAFFSWGIGDLFVVIAARRLDAYSSTFWSSIISFFLLSLYLPFIFDEIVKISGPILMLNIFLGIILMIGIITFREGFRVGNASLVGTIATSYAAVATILSIIFFKEQVSLYQTLSIIIIFVGVFLSMLDLGDIFKRKIKINTDKGVILALVSMFTWGIYFTFIKIPVKELGWFLPNYISFTLFPLLYLYLKIRGIDIKKPTMNNAFLPLLLAVFTSRLAELSFNLGIQRGYTSIVAPIAGANSVLFVILALIVFRDPITKQQIVGIIVTLIGIVALSILSV